MAVQLAQQPVSNAGEQAFGNTIPHGLDIKDLNLDQAKLVVSELFEEFKTTQEMKDKALIAFAISYLVRNKGVIVTDALGINASIELTKFIVMNSNEFICKI